MKKIKPFIKYLACFIIIYLIITFIYSIIQVIQLNTFEDYINFKRIFINTTKSLIVIYTIFYSLILVINILFNATLAEKLNKKSEKLRNLSKENILKEKTHISTKKRVLVIILIFIFIFLGIFIANLIRKIIIIKDLQEKISQYTSSSNYYVKETQIENNNFFIYEKYRKKDKEKIIMQQSTSNIKTEITIYLDYKSNLCVYTDPESNKIKNYNSKVPKKEIYNPYLLYSKKSITNSFVELLLTKIKEQNYNNKNCYVIKNSFTDYIYIDKETGLVLNTLKKTQEINYEYKFDFVSDEDVNISL